MKKSYVKPQACFEDFQLSANIAAGCSWKSGHNLDDCTFDVPGVGSVFITNEQGCKYVSKKDGDYGVCYHVPIDSTKLFTS